MLSRRNSGFTILELLIVIAIIAILMALLLPALVAAKKRSREVGCAACVKNMKTALENYYADWGGIYPIKPGGDGNVFAAGGVNSPGYYQILLERWKSNWMMGHKEIICFVKMDSNGLT